MAVMTHAPAPEDLLTDRDHRRQRRSTGLARLLVRGQLEAIAGSELRLHAAVDGAVDQVEDFSSSAGTTNDSPGPSRRAGSVGMSRVPMPVAPCKKVVGHHAAEEGIGHAVRNWLACGHSVVVFPVRALESSLEIDFVRSVDRGRVDGARSSASATEPKRKSRRDALGVAKIFISISLVAGGPSFDKLFSFSRHRSTSNPGLGFESG